MQTRRPLSASILAGTVWIILGVGTAAEARPQSLGDIARREAERRRATAPSSGRVYTNENLVAVDAAPAPPPQPAANSEPAAEHAPAPQAAASTKGPTVFEEDPETHKVNVRTTAPARERRDEQYWRARAKDVREQLARASADLAAAQSNLQALDRGPQTSATARERSLIAAAVQRFQSEVGYRQQDVAKLMTHAEMNKVPVEWIQ